MFGFSLSGSAQKSKSTTDTTNSFTNTTTRNVPSGERSGREGRGPELFNLDPGGQVAPTNVLTGAAGSAAGLSGSGVADTSWLNPHGPGHTPFASGWGYGYVGRDPNPYRWSTPRRPIWTPRPGRFGRSRRTWRVPARSAVPARR